MSLFVLALPVVPLCSGTTFARSDWPPHVTVLSNFVTDLTPNALLKRIGRILVAWAPLEVVIGPEALFGVEHDVRVRLVASPELIALHGSLVDAMQEVVDFETPNFVGDGFRPHLTLVPGASLPNDRRLRLDSVVLAELRRGTATVMWTCAFTTDQRAMSERFEEGQ